MPTRELEIIEPTAATSSDMSLRLSPEDTAFRIDTEEAANWYLRKLANFEAEKQRVQTQAAQIVKQLESDAEGLRFLYESELQNFVRQELAKKGNRRKSLTLLQGTAAFRTVPASLKVSDPAAALAYAYQACPDAVRTVPTLDAAKYRETAAETWQTSGELLPGVESVPEREAFKMTFGKRED